MNIKKMKFIFNILTKKKNNHINVQCAYTGLDKQKKSAKNCKKILTHNLKHMCLVLKRTVSLTRFF